MDRVDLTSTEWFKSSYSGAQGDCVEVADGFQSVVPVRDSKDVGRAPLVFPSESWSAFVSSLKS